MLLKILKKDFNRKKLITVALFIFIMLPALLISSGSNMIIELSNSLNYMFIQAKVPHFVQMHSGTIDQEAVERWSHNNELVKSQQAVEMINIDGTDVYLGDNTISEANSVMDLSFVKQNDSFDLLLDLENKPIKVLKGEIAVPIYHKQKEEMKIGDIVRIAHGSFVMEFRVTHFVRDAQMNPSIIHSKRFVVHELDYDTLKRNLGEVEYLIEFQLDDIDRLSNFSSSYESSNLPKTGPSINYDLFRIINVLTDSIVAVIVIFVSLLFCIIAVLCLRFTILASIEEDYREIGVMKAIGIQQRDIKRIYLVKYVVVAAFAAALGYVLSLFLSELFTANILLYMGAAPKSIPGQLIPFLASGVIFLIVVLSCMITLRRFRRISAVEALRSGNTGEAYKNRSFLSLSRTRFFSTNIFLGLRDVFHRFKMFWLLCFVFFVCTFIIIVPINFL
ncbi:MAG: ABC transporter permease, partial [Spirochaetales bacterium]|nr:ABC transporter permease [Spirochaetales bacterium]